MNKLTKYLIMCLIIAGVIYNIIFAISFDKIYPENINFTSIAEVVSLKNEKEKSNSYIIKIISSNVKKSKNTKIILYTQKNENLKYGDIIKISGMFSKAEVARNYKGFNYRNYLKQSKIYGSIYCKDVEKINHKSSLLEKIYSLKVKLYYTLDNIYTNDTNAFLKGILLGDSSNLNDEIKDNFKNSSMSHVLAISGMHVSYVVIGVKFILDKFINSKKLKNYIIVLILAFFVIITGCAPSCMRACIMSAMILISQNFYKKNNFYITVLITFLILIFMNPYNIFSVGMWLSFGGTVGIVLFHKFLVRFISCKFKIKSKKIKSFLNIFLVSFSAQILIIPIMIYCFNTISFTFFISNLMIYFLIGPILAFGYISLILGLIFPFVGGFIGVFESFLVQIIFKIAQLCSKLPFSKIYLTTPYFMEVILYYIIIIFIIYLFKNKKIKFLKLILSNKIRDIIQNNYKKIISSIIVLALIFNIVSIIPHNLKIYMVDIGQR